MSEISNIQPSELEPQPFLVGFSISETLSILLVVTKAGSACCKLQVKTTEEDTEE